VPPQFRLEFLFAQIAGMTTIEAAMADPAGESNGQVLRLDFDRRLMLQFRGSVVTSDAGLLAHRELDDALGLTTVAGEMLADARMGRNGRHALVGLFRQSVFGRRAGYEDVNDAERLRHDPTMRWIVGGRATSGCAASPSQMGRFETQWLAAERTFRLLLISPAVGSMPSMVAVRCLEIDLGVATRIGRWRVVRACCILGFEALHRRSSLDQRAIDRKMIGGHQLFAARCQCRANV
jgi:hypothetical protein